jgi:hypothetical protein
MTTCHLKVNDTIGGHDFKWSKPGSERQRLHILSHTWKIAPKDKHRHTQKIWSHTNSYVKNVCNSVTVLWNSGKEGKEKKLIEHEQSHKM